MNRCTLVLGLLALSQTASADDPQPDIRTLLERLERLEARLNSGTAGSTPARQTIADSVSESGSVSEASPATLPDALDALATRLAVLERRIEIQQEEAAAKAPVTPIVSIGDKGLSIKSAGAGDYELKLRGGLQFDYRAFVDDEQNAGSDTALFRRIRPTLEGTLGPLIAYRITPELAEDQTSLIDAYVDVRFNPAYSLRVGKLKGPIGLERLQSFNALTMIERGFPTELAPSRELGAQVFGELRQGEINYALGVFNGAPDGRNASATDADDNLEWQGRVFLEPWKNEANALSGLGFGIAGSIGDKDGSGNAFLPRYRTPGQQVFFQFRNTVAARGEHRRWSPQAYWFRNQWGVQAEYIRSAQELVLANTQGSLAELEHSAWQVTGNWVLTGEPTGYKGIERPFSPFELGQDGWGAFELVGRVGALTIDESAFPRYADANTSAQAAKAWGIGLNWYLNSNLKLVLNHTHTRFDGGAPLGRDRADEDTVFTRLQVAF